MPELQPHQTIGYAIARGLEYYGANWYAIRTIVWTRDGYKLLMRTPTGA